MSATVNRIIKNNYIPPKNLKWATDNGFKKQQPNITKHLPSDHTDRTLHRVRAAQTEVGRDDATSEESQTESPQKKKK